MSRYDLSDRDFARVEDLLPRLEPTGKRGHPLQNDPRNLLNGMLWILNTGAPWRDLPPRYGAYQSVHRWFLRWSQDNTIVKVFEALALPELVDTDLACMDGTVVRAHKASAGARKKKGVPAPTTREGKNALT